MGRLLLAGQALTETANLRGVAERNQPLKLEKVRQGLLHILTGDALPAVERGLAGRTLAKVGNCPPPVLISWPWSSATCLPGRL